MPPDSSLQEFAGVSAADSASSEVGDVEPGPTDEVETEAVILVKDESSRPECRICFDSEGDLICPCSCDGTMRYVHAECLDMARTRAHFGSLYRCDVCHEQFQLVYRSPVLQWLHVAASEGVVLVVLCVLPWAIWIHHVQLGLALALYVLSVTALSLELDGSYSTVSARRKTKAERMMETFLTYLFIIEAELGFVIMVEHFLLPDYSSLDEL